MLVSASTLRWRWQHHDNAPAEGGEQQQQQGGGEDTKDSVASTVADFGRDDDYHDNSASSCSQAFESKEDLLLRRFRDLVQQWMQCSVVMPSSRCLGLELPPAWQPLPIMLEKQQPEKLQFPLHGQILLARALDAAVGRQCGCIGSGSTTSGSSNKRRHAAMLPSSKRKMQPLLLLQGDHAESALPGGGSSCKNEGALWRRLLFESSGLAWFRDALGGLQRTRDLFANAYLNIQSISKPQEVAEAAEKKGCKPWAIVQLAESDASMCCHSLMKVPFKGFKRHSRNGVVFCFYGSRVFCTCMDEECRTLLRRNSKTYFCLAKEMEEIHLGGYDDLITVSQDEFFASIAQRSPFAAAAGPSGTLLLQEEARRRWSRVMQQGGTQMLRWTEEQARIEFFCCFHAPAVVLCDWKKAGGPDPARPARVLHGGGQRGEHAGPAREAAGRQQVHVQQRVRGPDLGGAAAGGGQGVRGLGLSRWWRQQQQREEEEPGKEEFAEINFFEWSYLRTGWKRVPILHQTLNEHAHKAWESVRW